MSEPKAKYKTKQETGDIRMQRLTVRMSANDLERLKQLSRKLSPYSPLSQGKTISVILEIAEKNLKV